VQVNILSSNEGVPNLITKNMVKQGACVIDVGINRVKNEKSGKTKLVGDVDFEGKLQNIFTLSCDVSTIIAIIDIFCE